MSQLFKGQSALRSGGVAWQAATRAPVLPQTRCFSVTPTSQANVVTFENASTPELASVLDEIRYKIILPSYIRQTQRKKLYRGRYANQLRNNPVEIDIDGEITKYYYMNPITDIPNTRKIMWSAIHKMQNRADFENLSPLLEGLRQAGRTLRPTDFAKIARLAGMRESIYIIIDAARQIKRTGFRLDKPETVNEVLSWVHRKAVDGDWDQAVTEKARTWAGLVVEQMQADEHQPEGSREGPDRGVVAPSLDPLPFAIELDLAATLAVKHNDGQDPDGEVAKLAQHVVRLWPSGLGLLQVYPQEAYKDDRGAQYLVHSSKFLVMAAPALHGMDMAIRLVDEKLADQLRLRRDALAGEVEKALQDDSVKQEGSRAHYIYDKLFRPEAAA